MNENPALAVTYGFHKIAELLRAAMLFTHRSSLIIHRFRLKWRHALRGQVRVYDLAREALRRVAKRMLRRRARAVCEKLAAQPARLVVAYTKLAPDALPAHFRQRHTPLASPAGCEPLATRAAAQRDFPPNETAQLIAQANRITQAHAWPLLGYGEITFGPEINWRRDVLKTDYVWPLVYHTELQVIRGDGTDARVVWELNRLGHFLTLARAFAVTLDEGYAETFFRHLASWTEQNPLGYGVNWSCAMEAALRALNVLAAWEIFRPTTSLTAERLTHLLQFFDQHGAFIRGNLEFSYLTTSNHYLSDVVGLYWLGALLPELQEAQNWREFGWREMLHEMDKQILPDGADFEASTGYHRLVLELFLYSFILHEANGGTVPAPYREKLRLLCDYLRAYLRPDGRAPLIGDTDGGQVLPFVKRDGDDHAYLLPLAALFFNDARYKISADGLPLIEKPDVLCAENSAPSALGKILTAENAKYGRGVLSLYFPEILWFYGAEGVRRWREMPTAAMPVASCAFPHAGAYIMRDGEHYLYFNANDSGIGGRGSHGHNDALSVEIAAHGVPFIVDPGSYVYSADLAARQQFRATSAHSTVQIDAAEQNTIAENLPFAIGNEARPQVLCWESTEERDFVLAEHYGYKRLPQPVTHRRAVTFYKKEGYWVIEDSFTGSGTHTFDFRFNCAPSITKSIGDGGLVTLHADANRADLLIKPYGLNVPPDSGDSSFACNYGARENGIYVNWKIIAAPPLKVHFVIIPLRRQDNLPETQTDEARARLLLKMWETTNSLWETVGESAGCQDRGVSRQLLKLNNVP